jgi:excisionase family DNA binding protein
MHQIIKENNEQLMVIIGNIMAEPLQMLTPKDVAGILGVHQKTVHLWLRSGRMTGIKISYRAWRIPRSALDQFIEQNRNVMPNGPESTAKEGTDERPVNAAPGPSVGNGVQQPPTMKHFLQDIMGEQPPEKNQNS